MMKNLCKGCGVLISIFNKVSLSGLCRKCHDIIVSGTGEYDEIKKQIKKNSINKIRFGGFLIFVSGILFLCILNIDMSIRVVRFFSNVSYILLTLGGFLIWIENRYGQ